MTTQEAYDDIRAYFTRPGAKLAVGSSNNPNPFGPPCKYRTEDGDQCAVGCLIPEAALLPGHGGSVAERAATCLPRCRNPSLLDS